MAALPLFPSVPFDVWAAVHTLAVLYNEVYHLAVFLPPSFVGLLLSAGTIWSGWECSWFCRWYLLYFMGGSKKLLEYKANNFSAKTFQLGPFSQIMLEKNKWRVVASLLLHYPDLKCHCLFQGYCLFLMLVSFKQSSACHHSCIWIFAVHREIRTQLWHISVMTIFTR